MAARMPPGSPGLDRRAPRVSAAELRSGDLDPERAAKLVDECARLATEAGAELDREVRAADALAGSSRFRSELPRTCAHGSRTTWSSCASPRRPPRWARGGDALQPLAGGKLIRPVLALATAEASDRDPADLLPLAAALELIHTTASSTTTCGDGRRRFSAAAPHLPRQVRRGHRDPAGDGLYAEAFRHLLAHQQAEPKASLPLPPSLATATGVNGMVGGQYIDVGTGAARGRRPAPPARASRPGG